MDEHDVLTSFHNGIHIVCYDNGRGVEFHGQFLDKVVDQDTCLGIQPTKRYSGVIAIALAIPTRFCIPPLNSDG